MSLLVARTPLTEALKTMLNAVLAVPDTQRFDVGRAPEDPPKNKDGLLIHGYGIIYPLVSPLMWGTLESPEDTLTAVYQITFVGRTSEHVQNLSDAAHAALLGRSANGQFSQSLAPSGLVIVERRCIERGSVLEGSGALWELPDTYELEAQAV
jgi:hypothetical protein